jgi:hypothetical protein
VWSEKLGWLYLWDQSTYYPAANMKNTLASNHHSPKHFLMALRIGHADLNALADKAAHDGQLRRRLKKLQLHHARISLLQASLPPPEPA